MRIDIHAHLMPDAAFDRMPAGMGAHRDSDADMVAVSFEGRAAGRGAPAPLRHLDLHREQQAARGVDLSVVGPWIDMVKAPLDPAVQHAWCAALNDSFTQTFADAAHSRFLAALPDLDGGRAAEELARAADLGAVGGMLAANPEHGTLARGDFEPLWQTASQRQLTLVLHPGEFQPPERLRDYFMVNLVGNPYETTLAVGSLLGARVPERFPDLRLLLVHGGGFFPYQYGRLTAGFARWPGLQDVTRRPPADFLRWFHYDTVLFDDAPVRYLLDVVGTDRVLAGSDCPFTMTDDRPFVDEGTLGLDEAERAEILGGNALRLFGLDDRV